MRLDKTNISCGIYQLDGLSSGSPTTMITWIKKALMEKRVMLRYSCLTAHARPPIILFNDADYVGSGERLYKHIVKKKYGKVTKIPHVNNSYTETECTLYVWELDYKALGIETLLQSYS